MIYTKLKSIRTAESNLCYVTVWIELEFGFAHHYS